MYVASLHVDCCTAHKLYTAILWVYRGGRCIPHTSTNYLLMLPMISMQLGVVGDVVVGVVVVMVEIVGVGVGAHVAAYP